VRRKRVVSRLALVFGEQRKEERWVVEMCIILIQLLSCFDYSQRVGVSCLHVRQAVWSERVVHEAAIVDDLTQLVASPVRQIQELLGVVETQRRE